MERKLLTPFLHPFHSKIDSYLDYYIGLPSELCYGSNFLRRVIKLHLWAQRRMRSTLEYSSK